MARMPSGLQEEGGARPAEQGHEGCPVPPKPPWRGAHEKSLQTCSPARTGRAGPELWLSGSQTRDRTAGRICPELGGGQGGALPLASVRDVWASPWTEAPSLGGLLSCFCLGRRQALGAPPPALHSPFAHRGVTRTPQLWGLCTEAPTQQPPPCVSTGSVTPLFCLKVLPDFSKPAAPIFLASVAAPFSPGPARPRIHAVSALCPDGAPTQASPVPSPGPHPRGLHASPSPGKPPGDSARRHALSAPFKAHLVQVNTEWCVSLRCPLLFTAFWSCLSD